ncbi:MAG TPA: YIP1 family protein [Desulfobacteria bacterium]|nr:YIP1 family protein [Desulfobacteria bacterium]
MVLSIVERIKGFLFSPSATFDASREDTLGDAFKYFVIILAIYAVLIAIVVVAAFSLISGMLSMFGVPELPFGAARGLMAAVVFFVGALVGGIIGIFITGLWLHIWVYLVGGKNGVEQTIKAVMYGETPSLLLGWIPILNFIAGIWTLIVGIIGVRQLHGLSTGKAVLAVILAILIPAIVIGVIIAALGPTMPGPGYPGPLGPGFGGF